MGVASGRKSRIESQFLFMGEPQDATSELILMWKAVGCTVHLVGNTKLLPISQTEQDTDQILTVYIGSLSSIYLSSNKIKLFLDDNADKTK